jgi:hypothetical protein
MVLPNSNAMRAAPKDNAYNFFMEHLDDAVRFAA